MNALGYKETPGSEWRVTKPDKPFVYDPKSRKLKVSMTIQNPPLNGFMINVWGMGCSSSDCSKPLTGYYSDWFAMKYSE